MLKSKLIRIVCITSVTVVFSLAVSLFTMFCLDRFFNMNVPFFSSLNGSGEEEVSEEESALEYDGYDGMVNMPDTDLLGEKYFSVSSTDAGIIYLKNYNYGAYNGKSWDRASEYKEFINSKYSAAYLTGFVMQENRKFSDTLSVYSYVDLYAMPSYLVPTDEEGRVQSSDVYSNGKADEEYNVLYYSELDWRTLRPIQDEDVAEFELQYRDYAKTEYTRIGSWTEEKMKEIISENGLEKETVAKTIYAVVTYLRATAELDVIPNDELEKESDVAVAFLTQYKKGNLNHFASAAALLFRAMDIPARYTEGFYTYCIPGTAVEITELNKYYWVEVYVDGIGWICVDVMRYNLGNDEEDNQLGVPDELDLERLIFMAYATSTERIYLKSQSYGDYSGNSWGGAPEYSEYIGGAYSATYMPGLILKDKNTAKLGSVTIVPVDDIAKKQFVVPYYTTIPTNEYYLQNSDVYMDGDARKSYTQSYYSVPSYSDNSGMMAMDPTFESAYREFVYQNYLYVDAETAAYMARIIEENALDAFSENNKMSQIAVVADFIENSADYSYYYDRNLDKEPNVAIAFLETYKKGICQHYATAATLLFRSLGIPARYTVGYVANAEAGVGVEVKAKNSHAWVEVYIDGFGWQYVEVTGGGDSLFYIELYPDDMIVLDFEPGDKIYPQNIKTEGFEPFKAKGYSLAEVAVSGANSVGLHESYVTSYKILDPDGNDVTELFDVDTARPGFIDVRAHVTLKPADIKHIYDGEMKYPEEVDGFVNFELDGYELVDVEFTGEVEAGHYKSIVEKCKIFKDGKDVTGYFDIDNSKEGKLDILYGEVELTPEKTTHIFTGDPLAPTGVKGFEEFEEKGFSFVCDFTEYTYIGNYRPEIMEGYVIYDEEGVPVTDLFEVKTKPGNMMIKSDRIDIVLANDVLPGERVEYKYSVGKNYFIETEIIGFEPYHDASYGFSYQVSVASGPCLMEDARLLSYEIYDPFGVIVQRYTTTQDFEGNWTELYEVFDSEGNLVSKSSKFEEDIMLFDIHTDQCYAEMYVYYTEFAFVSESTKKVYDGKTHYLKEEDITLDATTAADLAAFGISYEFYDMASITNAGSVEAKFKVKFTDANGDDCTPYIKMASGNKFGLLELTLRPITIKLEDITIKKNAVRNHPFYNKDLNMMIYNSNAYETTFAEDGTRYLAEGHTIVMEKMVIEGSCSADNLKINDEFARIVSIVIVDERGNDVTSNYSKNFPYCTLKIGN